MAFLSDRDGQMDVWVTQIGSGQFHNLTRGSAPELINPSVRTLGFSPDGAFVTYWVRKPGGAKGGDISIWAVPTLGGEPRPYLEGIAEYDWSRDGTRLAYHTPGPGDPLYVTSGPSQPDSHPIFTAPAGLHSHFPLWSPDAAFIYIVQGDSPTNSTSGASAPRRRTRAHHYAQRPCDSSGLLGSTHAHVSRHRPRRLRPVALQHRRGAPHPPPPQLWPRPVHLACRQRRRPPFSTTRAAPDRTLWRLPID